MLSKILSVSGKPGLYRLISTGKNLNVVESLLNGKRLPLYITEKLVALSDISIYTVEKDVPLREVFKKMQEKENGNKASVSTKASGKELFSYFEEVLPDYDKERVYASDIKKIISWYNIIAENKIDLDEEVSETEEKTETDETQNTNE